MQRVGRGIVLPIEDKVVRFAERDAHHVFLEPETVNGDSIYCNGISTSLPADVQEQMIPLMQGCQHAEILQMGYAVEYDIVRPHQINATCETKAIRGLFLAGQINGTSGYEEAAGQGLLAGFNAARLVQGKEANDARSRSSVHRCHDGRFSDYPAARTLPNVYKQGRASSVAPSG